MYYIDNFALLILIYLLKSKQPIILRCYYDDFSEEELITYFDDVNNIIKENSDSENLVTSQKTNDGNVEISFINYSNLENYLKTYIEKYKNGDFKSYTSSAIAYAWFVWLKGYQGKTIVEWIN